jgi:hypothetical protein
MIVGYAELAQTDKRLMRNEPRLKSLVLRRSLLRKSQVRRPTTECS